MRACATPLLLKTPGVIRITVMKRILTVLIIAVVLSAADLAAASQKIHPVDSRIYGEISDIYLLTGHAMPSSAGPWTGAELLSMIRAIPFEEIPASMRETARMIVEELEKGLDIDVGPVSLQFGGDFNPELYAHTETNGITRMDTNGVYEKSFVGRENWAYDLTHSNPLFQLTFRFDVSDMFYVYVGFPFKAGFHGYSGYEREIGATSLGTNIPGLQTIGNGFAFSLDPNWPDRAFASFGGRAWNVQIGRDRLSWGLGMTGNLGISDNLPHHDMLRFTAFSNSFKYTFLISSFPHKVNFYDPYRGSDMRGNVEKDPIRGINLYLAHRVEVRLFSDRLSLSVTEAIMYASDTGTLDLRIFNPAIIFHNIYTPSNSNSTLVLEADWTPVKGLNIYGQFILDDLAITGEKAGSPDSYGYPNALGYLAGAKYAMEVWDGILSFNIEGAFIDPYTYLRYDRDPWQPEAYGLDYIVSTRTYVVGSPEDCLVYDEYVLGYRYGGDCTVADLNVEWKKSGLIAVSANAFFMAHGTHDKWTGWTETGGQGKEQWDSTSATPTSAHESVNYRYSDAGDRNAACYTLDLGLGCSWNISSSLRLFGQADLMFLWNSYNVKGNRERDFQIVLGAAYSL